MSSEGIAEDLGAEYVELMESMRPLLSGANSLEEICGRLLLQGFGLEAIFNLLRWLDRQELMRESPDAEVGQLSAPERQFYSSQVAWFNNLTSGQGFGQDAPSKLDGWRVQLALKQAVVVLAGMGATGYHLSRSLALAGVGNIFAVHEEEATRTASLATGLQEQIENLNPLIRFVQVAQMEDVSSVIGDSPPSLVVYCSDHFNPETCQWLNKSCLDYSIPFLVSRQREREVELGPLVIPGDTACYVCYELRRKAAMFTDESLQEPGRANSPRLNFPLASELLALEVVKILARLVEPVTRARLWSLNLMSGMVEVHPVLKLPRCPACGVHKVKPAHRLWEK